MVSVHPMVLSLLQPSVVPRTDSTVRRLQLAPTSVQSAFRANSSTRQNMHRVTVYRHMTRHHQCLGDLRLVIWQMTPYTEETQTTNILSSLASTRECIIIPSTPLQDSTDGQLHRHLITWEISSVLVLQRTQTLIFHKLLATSTIRLVSIILIRMVSSLQQV